MGTKYIRYNNQDQNITIDGYMIAGDIVCLSGKNMETNESGFILYEETKVLLDCSEYKYRWDVLEDNPNRIYYTNTEGNVQTVSLPEIDDIDIVEPLSNEALTECVADLMYEVGLMQLGMMGGE